MALPTLSKTWEQTYKAILASDVGGSGTALKMNKYMLWFIKQGFISGSSPWSVLGSSDSTTAGLDTVDRWTDYTKLVPSNAGGTVHSWIILKQTGMGSGNLQLCIDFIGDGTYGGWVTLVVSFNAGFTGGSTTNRPTATDECAEAFAAGHGPTWYNVAVHVFRSTDGALNRVLVVWNGSIQYMWIIDTPKNPKAWWTTPYVFGIFAPSINIWSGTLGYSMIDGTKCIMRGTTHCINTTPLISSTQMLAPDLSGEWFTFPIGLISTEVTRKGRMGELYDLYFCPSVWPSLYLPASPKAYVAAAGLLTGWELGKPFIVMTGSI